MNGFTGKKAYKKSKKIGKRNGPGGKKRTGVRRNANILKQLEKEKTESGEAGRFEESENKSQINSLAVNGNKNVDKQEKHSDFRKGLDHNNVVTRSQSRNMTGHISFFELDDIGFDGRRHRVVATTNPGLVIGDATHVAEDYNVALTTNGEPEECDKKMGCIRAKAKVHEVHNMKARGQASPPSNKAEVNYADQDDKNGLDGTVKRQVTNETKSPLKSLADLDNESDTDEDDDDDESETDEHDADESDKKLLHDNLSKPDLENKLGRCPDGKSIRIKRLSLDQIRLKTRVTVQLTRIDSIPDSNPQAILHSSPKNEMEQDNGDPTDNRKDVKLPSVPGISAQSSGCLINPYEVQSTTCQPMMAERTTPLKERLRKKDKYEENPEPVYIPSYRVMTPEEIFADLPPRINRSAVREMQDGAIIKRYDAQPEHKKSKNNCDKKTDPVQIPGASRMKNCTDMASTARSGLRQSMKADPASGSYHKPVSPFTPRKFPLSPEEYNAMLKEMENDQ